MAIFYLLVLWHWFIKSTNSPCHQQCSGALLNLAPVSLNNDWLCYWEKRLWSSTWQGPVEARSLPRSQLAPPASRVLVYITGSTDWPSLTKYVADWRVASWLAALLCMWLFGYVANWLNVQLNNWLAEFYWLTGFFKSWHNLRSSARVGCFLGNAHDTVCSQWTYCSLRITVPYQLLSRGTTEWGRVWGYFKGRIQVCQEKSKLKSS